MKKNKKIIIVVLMILLLIGGGTAIHFYNTLFSSNVVKQADEYLYIPSNSTIDDVIRIIKIKNIIQKYPHITRKIKKQQSTVW